MPPALPGDRLLCIDILPAGGYEVLYSSDESFYFHGVTWSADHGLFVAVGEKGAIWPRVIASPGQ